MVSRIQRWFGNGWFGIAELLITVFCVFLSLSFHEFSHGYAAYKLGDDTAKNMGRLNMSPLSHIDPIGAVCLFLFGFGWAQPVPINPNNFAVGKRKRGMVITALAGPLGNLIMAFVCLLFMRVISRLYGGASGMFASFVTVVYILLSVLESMNIALAVFNLIPIPPLDGSKILNAVLPQKYYFKLMEYEQYGFILLIILINLPIFDNLLYFLTGSIEKLFNLMIGLIPFL